MIGKFFQSSLNCLSTKIRKSRTKKFYSVGPRGTNVYGRNRSKLECFFASIRNFVKVCKSFIVQSPGAGILKHFKVVMNYVAEQASVFLLSVTFYWPRQTH